MVEPAWIEDHDARVAPLVVFMAGATSLRLLATTEPAVLAHIRPNVLMAIGAQGVLRGTVKLEVAVFAIRFSFGVPLNQLARREHRLNALRERSIVQTGRGCDKHQH